MEEIELRFGPASVADFSGNRFQSSLGEKKEIALCAGQA
jgi:hypothetical protein